MDSNIRKYLTEAKYNDVNALKTAYELITIHTKNLSPLDGSEKFNNDLYILCAEQALQLGLRDMCKNCLQMYFKANIPINQFLGRAYLCQAQLSAPTSAESTDNLDIAISYILKTIQFATKQSRYYFLVYNATVIYWRLIRPFLKSGCYALLIPSLSKVVKALEWIEEQDYDWRAQLMIVLIECLLDARKTKDASHLANTTAEFIKTYAPHMYKKIFSIQVYYNLVDHAKVRKDVKSNNYFTAIFRIQKLKFDLKTKEHPKDLSDQLTRIYQFLTSQSQESRAGSSEQSTSSGTGRQSSSGRRTPAGRHTPIGRHTPTGKHTPPGRYTPPLRHSASGRHTPTSRPHGTPQGRHSGSSGRQETPSEQRLTLAEQRLTAIVQQLSPRDKLPLIMELARLSLDVRHPDVAASCINEFKKDEIKDSLTAIELECLTCELEIQRLRIKSEKYTKSFMEKSLGAIRRLDQALQNAIREGDPNIIQVVCVTLWNVCLPLLQPSLRKHVKKSLSNVAKILDEIDSLLIQLRCQVHMEVAYIEEEDDRIDVAMEHLKKAHYFGNGSPYQENIEIALHRLEISSMLYETSEIPEDKAAKIIERARRGNASHNVQERRSLLVNAGLTLAPDAFQTVLDSENEAKVSINPDTSGLIGQLAARAQHHISCIQKVGGHLDRLGTVNDKMRVRLWAELAKVARKEEIWDVSRAACRFCLLYDDGRWKMTYPSKGKGKTIDDTCAVKFSSGTSRQQNRACASERNLLRLFVDVSFINGEATIAFLNREDIQFNNHPIPPNYKSKHHKGHVAPNPEGNPEWIQYREWIDSLSQYATKNFLRGSELGVELKDPLIVCNAAMYLWNYNHHLLIAGRYRELVDTFQSLLDAIKQTGHLGETILLVMLCNALAQGLIQPWIPNLVGKIEKKESDKLPGEGKKSLVKRNEKPSAPQILSVEPEGIPYVNKALEVCEYALLIISGAEHAGIVPIAVRHHILITWVRVKQLLQQQVGSKLGIEDEGKSSKDSEPRTSRQSQRNKGQNPMAKALVPLEMYSCNNVNLMKFNVPNISDMNKLIFNCFWTDKLVELEALTRLMQIAYTSHNYELVSKCGQKAFKLDGVTMKTAGFKKLEKYNHKVEQELLSVAACLQGLSSMDTAFGSKEMHMAAIKAFEQSARYGEKAGNTRLVMNAARNFWNSCLSMIASPTERKLLEQPVRSFLSAMHTTYAKDRKVDINEEQHEQHAQSTAVQLAFEVVQKPTIFSGGDTEDDRTLRAAMYGLLFHIYAGKEDWKGGLKVLDEAIQDMPRTKHKLLIFKHRIMAHVRLGRSISMDLQKLKDESEQYLSSMWRRVVIFSKKRTEQISCYQKSIEALEKPESNWQKVDHLIEYGEWLYSNDFPQNDVLCILDWAVDLLLSMKLCVKPKVEEDFKVKKKKLKGKYSQEKQKLEEQKPEKNPEPEATVAPEKEIIPRMHQAQIGVEHIDPNLSLADLQDVRQLQTLVEIHTLMAVISSRASSQHRKHCLMAYSYVRCIWQAALATAGSILRELVKNAPPSPDLAPASKFPKKSKKKDAKEIIPPVRVRPKWKENAESIPANSEEWATYDCPDEIRVIFNTYSDCSLINKSNILKPTYSLFFIDLLVNELQALSYTHLTLPVLQLGEVIACEVLNEISLSDLYHFRLAKVCTELNVMSAAEYHGSVPGTVFIYDEERAKVRQEIAKLQDEKLEFPEESMEDLHERLTDNQSKPNEKMNMDVQTSGILGKKLSEVSTIDLWIDKAEVLLELGFYQPVRLLLAEAHKAAKELGNKEAEGRSLYLLAVQANCELNFSQAQHLLEEVYKIRGNEYHWYNMINCMVDTILGKKSQDYHESASNFLKKGIVMFRDVMEEKPNRIPVLKYMIASLEARLTLIEVDVIKSLSGFNLNRDQNIESLISACDQLNQASQTLIQCGYKHEAVRVIIEYVEIRRTLANYSEDEELKHSHLLAAYGMMEKAVLIEEDIFRELMILLPLTSVATICLPATEKLACVKIIFAELILDMFQLVIIKEKKKAEAEREKKLMQRTIEEFIRSTPDYTSTEEEWVTVCKVLGQNALLQLQTGCRLKTGSPEIKTKCLYLTGKCLRWLAVQLDPIHFGHIWVQQMKFVVMDNKSLEAEENDDDIPVSTQQMAKCVAKAKQLKHDRILSQRYLAQASEILMQSINWALLYKYTECTEAASLEMVECFGQFDPVSAGHYLALYQSCRATVMLKNVLEKVVCNTSSSQLAALTNLQQKLSENRLNKLLLKTVNERLETFGAWENISIHPQHFSLLNEFPSNFNIIILQHSEDRTLLYGALLEKPKSAGQKIKTSQGSQSLTQAKIVRASVDPTVFSHLLQRFRKHKQNLMNYFLKCNKDTENAVANKSMLLAHFNNISEALEAYLRPVLSQFDFSIFGQSIYKTDKAKRSKNKEMKSVSEKSLQDTPGAGGECIILLPDNLLLELPLETLGFLQTNEITSVSRDFSLQFLYNRFHRAMPEEVEVKKSPKTREKQKKKKKLALDRVVPPYCFPIDTNKFKYIVEPYDTAKDSEFFNPIKIMTELKEQYQTLFTSQWHGIMGSDHIPSHADWEQQLSSCKAFIFYGTERFLANMLPSKLICMNLQDCQLVIILDLVQTSQSTLRQSMEDVDKSKLELSIEQQLETIMILSLTGVRSIMANQWNSTLENNAMRLTLTLANLLESGRTTGETVWKLIRAKKEEVNLANTEETTNPNNQFSDILEHENILAGIESTSDKNSVINNDGRTSELLLEKKLSAKPTAMPSLNTLEDTNIFQSSFNFIMYGLPNLIVI